MLSFIYFIPLFKAVVTNLLVLSTNWGFLYDLVYHKLYLWTCFPRWGFSHQTHIKGYTKLWYEKKFQTNFNANWIVAALYTFIVVY